MGGISTEADNVVLLLAEGEPLRLELEHRAVAPALGHELVVRAELDDPAVLEHADAVDVSHGGEAVRHEDRRAVPGGGQHPLEDLRLAPHVELGTHAELMAQGGRYRTMFELQAQRFATGAAEEGEEEVVFDVLS